MNDPLWIDLTHPHPQAEQKIYVNMSLAKRLGPGGPGAIISSWPRIVSKTPKKGGGAASFPSAK